MIFGLALSIGALTLIEHELANFQALLLSLGFYAFTFIVLISIWGIHTSILSVLPAQTPRLISLNIFLLFFVSIEPFLFNELLRYNNMFYEVSIVYGFDLAGMFLILALFNHFVSRGEGKLVPESSLRRFKLARNMELVMVALCAVSVSPVFSASFPLTLGSVTWQVSARSIMWFSALPFGYSQPLWERFIKPKGELIKQ